MAGFVVISHLVERFTIPDVLDAFFKDIADIGFAKTVEAAI